MYGKIKIVGYSKDNRYASFEIVIKERTKFKHIAYGIYDFVKERTRYNFTRGIPYGEEIIKEILSTNDWDINLKCENKYHLYHVFKSFIY